MNEGASAWPLSLRLIHWASAALVLGALGLGVYMVQLTQDPAERFELTQTHKSIGFAVLALALARLCLRIVMRAPAPEPRGTGSADGRQVGACRALCVAFGNAFVGLADGIDHARACADLRFRAIQAA